MEEQQRLNTGITNFYNNPNPEKMIQPVAQPWKEEDIEGAFATWLQYNQVRFTIPFLSNILVTGNDGIAADQSAVFNTILEKEPVIQAHLQTRKLAVQAVDWDIMGDNEYKRNELKKIIEDAGIEKLKAHLLDAIGFGYSGAGINWCAGGASIKNFQMINHVNWMFDRYGNVAFITRLGKQIPVTKENCNLFVLHTHTMKAGIPTTGGLIRSLIWTYFFKHMAVQQQARFLEKYGMPFLIAKINSADFENEQLRSTIKNQLRNLGAEGAGVISNNAEVNTFQSGSGAGGNGDFARWISYSDSVYALCILGQLASSSDAGGFSKGQIQESVRQDLIKADCKALEETINNQIIKPLEMYKYGTSECSFAMDYNEPEDLTAKSKLVIDLNGAGFRAKRKFIEDTFNIPLEEDVKPEVSTPDVGSMLTAMGNVPPPATAPVTPAPIPTNLSVGAPEGTPLSNEPLSVPPPPATTPLSDLKKKSNILSFADSLEAIKANAIGIINGSALPDDAKSQAINAINSSDETNIKSNVSGIVSSVLDTDTEEVKQARQDVASAINSMDTTITVAPEPVPTPAIPTTVAVKPEEKEVQPVMAEAQVQPKTIQELQKQKYDILAKRTPEDTPEKQEADYSAVRAIDDQIKTITEQTTDEDVTKANENADKIQDTFDYNYPLRQRPTTEQMEIWNDAEYQGREWNKLNVESKQNAINAYEKRKTFMDTVEIQREAELEKAGTAISGKPEISEKGEITVPTEKRDAIMAKYDAMIKDYNEANPRTKDEDKYGAYSEALTIAYKNGLQDVVGKIINAAIVTAAENPAKLSVGESKNVAIELAWDNMPIAAKQIMSKQKFAENVKTATNRYFLDKDFTVAQYKTVKDAEGFCDGAGIVASNMADKFITSGEAVYANLGFMAEDVWYTITGDEKKAKQARDNYLAYKKYNQLSTDQIKGDSFWEQTLYGTAEFAAPVLMSVAGSVVGAPVALMMNVGIMTSQTYNELRQQDVGFGSALIGSMAIGIINGNLQSMKIAQMAGLSNSKWANVLAGKTIDNIKALENKVSREAMDNIVLYALNPLTRGVSAATTAIGENILQEAVSLNFGNVTRAISDVINNKESSQYNAGMAEQAERYWTVLKDTTAPTAIMTVGMRGIHSQTAKLQDKLNAKILDEESLRSKQVTSENTKEVLNNVFEKLGVKTDNLEIIPDAKMLREGEKAAIEVKDNKVQVYIDPTRIANARDLVNTVVGHEVFGHYFFDAMPKEQRTKLIDEISRYNDSLPENKKFFNTEDKYDYVKRFRDIETDSPEMKERLDAELLGRYLEENFTKIQPKSLAGQYLDNAKNWIMTKMLSVVDAIVNNVLPKEQWKTKSAKWLADQRERAANELLGSTYKNFTRDRIEANKMRQGRYSATAREPSVDEISNNFKLNDVYNSISKLRKISDFPNSGEILTKIKDSLRDESSDKQQVLNEAMSTLEKNYGKTQNPEIKKIYDEMSLMSKMPNKDYIIYKDAGIRKAIRDLSTNDDARSQKEIANLNLDRMRLRSMIPAQKILEKATLKDYYELIRKRNEALDLGEPERFSRNYLDSIIEDYSREATSDKDLRNVLYNNISKSADAYIKRQIDADKAINMDDVINFIDSQIPDKYKKLASSGFNKTISNATKQIKQPKEIKHAEPLTKEIEGLKDRNSIVKSIITEKNKPAGQWDDNKINFLQDKLAEFDQLNNAIGYLKNKESQIQDQLKATTDEAEIQNLNAELAVVTDQINRINADTKQFLKNNNPRYGITLSRYFKNIYDFGTQEAKNAVLTLDGFKNAIYDYIYTTYDTPEDIKTASDLLNKSFDKIMAKFKNKTKAIAQFENVLEAIPKTVEIRHAQEARKLAETFYKKGMLYNTGEEMYNEVIKRNNPDISDWASLSQDYKDIYNGAVDVLSRNSEYNEMLNSAEIRLLMAEDSLTRNPNDPYIQAEKQRAETAYQNTKNMVSNLKESLFATEHSDIQTIFKNMKTEWYTNEMNKYAKDIVKSIKYLTGAEKKNFINEFETIKDMSPEKGVQAFNDLKDKAITIGNERERKVVANTCAVTIMDASNMISKAAQRGQKAPMPYAYMKGLEDYIGRYKFTEEDAKRLDDWQQKNMQNITQDANNSFGMSANQNGQLNISQSVIPPEIQMLLDKSNNTNGKFVTNLSDVSQVKEIVNNKNMTTDKLLDIIEDIKLIKSTGKGMLQLENDAKKAQFELDKEASIAELSGDMIVVDGFREQQLKTMSGAWSRGRLWWSAIRKENIINWLVKFKDGSVFKEKTFDKVFSSMEKLQELNEQWNDSFMDIYGTALAEYSVKKPQYEISHWDERSLGQVDANGYPRYHGGNTPKVDADGNPLSDKLSLSELMFVYAQSQKPMGYMKLLNTRLRADGFGKDVFFTPKSISQCVDVLKNIEGGKYIDMIEKQFEFYDKVQYPLINEVFKSEHGVDMPKQEKYFPKNMTLFNGVDDIGLQAMSQISFQRAVSKGFTFEQRSLNGFDATRMDYFGAVNNNAQKVLYYAAFNDTVKDLNRMFTDKDIALAIKSRSNAVYDILKNNWINTIATNSVPSSPLDGFCTMARNIFSIAALGLKVPTVLIQLPQFVLSLNDVHIFGKGGFGWTASEYLMNPIESMDFVTRNSTVMKLRQHNVAKDFAKLSSQMEIGMADLFNGKTMSFDQIKDLFSNIVSVNVKESARIAKGLTTDSIKAIYGGIGKGVMYPLFAVEQASVGLAWKANYDMYVKERGMNHSEACKAADGAIRKTQPLSDIKVNSEMFNHPAFRLFTLFKGPQNVIFSSAFENNAKAWYQLFSQDDELAKRFGKSLYTFARANSLMALSAIMIQMLRSMGQSNPWNNPNESIMEIAKSQTDGIPMLNTVFNTFYTMGDTAWRKSKGDYIQPGIASFAGGDDIMSTFIRSIGTASRYEDPDARWALMKQYLPLGSAGWAFENDNVRSFLVDEKNGSNPGLAAVSICFSANQLKLAANMPLSYSTGSNQKDIDAALVKWNHMMPDKKWYPRKLSNKITFEGKAGKIDAYLNTYEYDIFRSITVDNFNNNAKVIRIKNRLKDVNILSEYDVKELNSAMQKARTEAKESIKSLKSFLDRYDSKLKEIDYL